MVGLEYIFCWLFLFYFFLFSGAHYYKVFVFVFGTVEVGIFFFFSCQFSPQVNLFFIWNQNSAANLIVKRCYCSYKIPGKNEPTQRDTEFQVEWMVIWLNFHKKQYKINLGSVNGKESAQFLFQENRKKILYFCVSGEEMLKR